MEGGEGREQELPADGPQRAQGERRRRRLVQNPSLLTFPVQLHDSQRSRGNSLNRDAKWHSPEPLPIPKETSGSSTFKPCVLGRDAPHPHRPFIPRTRKRPSENFETARSERSNERTGEGGKPKKPRRKERRALVSGMACIGQQRTNGPEIRQEFFLSLLRIIGSLKCKKALSIGVSSPLPFLCSVSAHFNLCISKILLI